MKVGIFKESCMQDSGIQEESLFFPRCFVAAMNGIDSDVKR